MWQDSTARRESLRFHQSRKDGTRLVNLECEGAGAMGAYRTSPGVSTRLRAIRLWQAMAPQVELANSWRWSTSHQRSEARRPAAKRFVLPV